MIIRKKIDQSHSQSVIIDHVWPTGGGGMRSGFKSHSLSKAMSLLKSGKLVTLPDIDGECLLETVMSVLLLHSLTVGPLSPVNVPRRLTNDFDTSTMLTDA